MFRRPTQLFSVAILALWMGTVLAHAGDNPYYLESWGDNYVVKVPADNFKFLPMHEKLRAYYLYKVGSDTRDLTFTMSHPKGVELKNFLEALYLGSEALNRQGKIRPEVFQCITDHLKTYYLWHGPYVWPGKSKVVLSSPCTQEAIQGVIQSIQSQSFGSILSRDLNRLESLKALIFDPEFEPFRRSPDDDDKRGPNVFYDPSLTTAEIEAFRKENYPHKFYPINTQLQKSGGKIEEVYFRAGGRDVPLPYPMPHEDRFNGLQEQISALEDKGELTEQEKLKKAALEKSRNSYLYDWARGMLNDYFLGREDKFPRGDVEPGLYKETFQRAIQNIRKAQMFTPRRNKELYENAYLEFSIRYLQTGAKIYSAVTWLAGNLSASPLITSLDFSDGYADPLGVSAGWGPSITMKLVDPLVKQMTDAALIKELQGSIPWDRSYDNPQPKANSELVDLINGWGSLCPACWSGYNNNDDHLGSFADSRTVVVANWAQARMLGAPPGSLDEFYRAGPLKEIVRNQAATLRNVMVILHESHGHAIGKRAPGYQEKLNPIGDMLEEARAESAALYLMRDPKVMKMANLSREQVDAWYLAFVVGTLENMARIPEGKFEFLRPHERADHLITTYLVKNGYGVKAVNAKGEDWKPGEKVFYDLVDSDRMYEGVGKVLSELMQAIGVPDVAKAKELDESYGKPIPEEWVTQVQARAKAVGYKPQWVGLFPELKLVMNGAQIGDVQVFYSKDFLTQQLAFSGKSLLTVGNGLGNSAPAAVGN